MFCTNCGKDIKDGSTFCTECGANIQQLNMPQQSGVSQQPYILQQQPVTPEQPNVLQQSVSPGQSNVSQQPGMSRQQKKSRRQILIPIAILAVLLTIAGILFVVLQKGEEDRDSGASSSEDNDYSKDQKDDPKDNSLENKIELVPTATPTPIIAVTLPVWQGYWTRLGDTYYDGSLADITDQGDGTFYFSINANNGANTGFVEGYATAIDNNAIYQNEEDNYYITFDLKDGILTVTAGGDFYGILGAGVSIDGEYTLEEQVKEIPTMQTLGILEDSSQEQVFKELVQEEYDLYISTCQTIIKEANLDASEAKVYSGALQGLYSIMECIIMVTPENQIWTAIIVDDTVKYYTNTDDTNILPNTINLWRSDFSYLDVIYMNYDESNPSSSEEEDDGDYTAPNDYYYNAEYNTVVDDITFSPQEAYYQDGELYLNMYVYNGRSTPIHSIEDIYITVNNAYETIAYGYFDALPYATIDPNSYITWTFHFIGDAVYIKDSDISYLETITDCNYTY